MKKQLHSIFLLSTSVFLAACSDEPTLPKTAIVATPALAAGERAGALRTITWLEFGDVVRPEAWVAAADANSDEPEFERVRAYQSLLRQASDEYLETTRIVANRIVQLYQMLQKRGFSERPRELIGRFLGQTDNALCGTEHIYSDICSHYHNLRSGRPDRKRALAELRGDGARARQILLQTRAMLSSNTQASSQAKDLIETKEGAPGMLKARENDRISQGVAPKHRKDNRLHVDATKVAGTLHEDEVRAFVEEAARLSRYALPDEMPRIVRLDTAEVRRVVCRSRNCGAVAFFDDRTRTVYIDNRMDLERHLVARSYVIHEVIHYFHLLDGKLAPDLDCSLRLELEIEAYKIQNRYLLASGSRYQISTRLLSGMCRN